jgi:hypothetical protein
MRKALDDAALGSGTGESLQPRGPRLVFDEACRII